MRFSCPTCSKKYEIPEHGLPKGQSVLLTCSNCSAHIRLSSEGVVSPAPSPQQKIVIEVGRNTAKKDAAELKKKILDKVDTLRAMPDILLKARAMLRDPGSNFSELASLLETDQAIAARVLRIANSAYYGMQGKVGSIKYAAQIIGFSQVGEIIQMASAAGFMDHTLPGYGILAGQMWQHSLFVAYTCRAIAVKVDPALSEDAFSAGLLHDAGKLVLDPVIQRHSERFKSLCHESGHTHHEAEYLILGFNHAEIASEIATRWSFPEHLAGCILNHHTPITDAPLLTRILYAGNAMTGGTGFDLNPVGSVPFNTVSESLGLAVDDSIEIATKAAVFVDSISSAS